MSWELSAYIIYIVATSVLFVLVISLGLKNKKQTKLITQLTFDRMEILSKLGEMSMKQQAGEIEQTDGFMKFISESRNWAFEYIEDVQDALEAYDKAVNGLPVPRDISVEQAAQISNAYETLMSFLPKENDGTIRN